MSAFSIPLPELAASADDERKRIRQEFEAGTDVREILRSLSELADVNTRRVFNDLLRDRRGAASGVALIALSGYGQRFLFPSSDLDLLFLFANEKIEQELRPSIADLSRCLSNLGFRANVAMRLLEQCRRIEADTAEFQFALLDRRFLIGDQELFEKLDVRVLPASVKQARTLLVSQLQSRTRSRLARYGNTIFHLEPNVRDAPGGLRDYQAAAWLRQITGDRKIPLLLNASEDAYSRAVEFIATIRCFLHYRNGRNDNTLTYELQADAADRALGARDGISRGAAEWMRLYFRHARVLNRHLLRKLEQAEVLPQTLRQRLLNVTRAAAPELLSSGAFAVRNGRLEILDQPALSDRAVMFALFAEAARTGITPSRRAERNIFYITEHPELPARNTQVTWPVLQQILGADYPAVALRSMKRLGVLSGILPEFGRIDALVVRDFFHRYTVDEHSMRAIEHLQELADPPDLRGTHFKELWKGLERRDLLVLALLLHNVGKGMGAENYLHGSLEALETAAARLGLASDELEEVRFLIARHLDMSATMQRRDIFDPATISAFAATVGSLERLQSLTLFTYADIHALNPEALTPWKAEMLWQLFAATASYLSRALDRDRLHTPDESHLLTRVQASEPAFTTEQIEQFLEGFPRRYMAVHSPPEIAAHLTLYQALTKQPVQADIRLSHHTFVLTLLTVDRPALLATISGVFASEGLNIIKADAFANSAGFVLDSLRFIDPRGTLEAKQEEVEKLRRKLTNTIQNESRTSPQLRGRTRSPFASAIDARIEFDDSASERSTLMQVAAADRPGLLYDLASSLARLNCNIEVALIDTEGKKAVDVFYLTEDGAKLTTAKQKAVREALSSIL
jgi:[protein-PII] uridylyltransferase